MRQLHYLYTTNGFFSEANGILLFKFIFVHTIIDLIFRLIFKAASLYACLSLHDHDFFFQDCKNVYFNDVRGLNMYFLIIICFAFLSLFLSYLSTLKLQGQRFLQLNPLEQR
jgi:hypothetical protein